MNRSVKALLHIDFGMSPSFDDDADDLYYCCSAKG
jgi:hypothetical protein